VAIAAIGFVLAALPWLDRIAKPGVKEPIQE
jgi:hypothetical protein